MGVPWGLLGPTLGDDSRGAPPADDPWVKQAEFWTFGGVVEGYKVLKDFSSPRLPQVWNSFNHKPGTCGGSLSCMPVGEIRMIDDLQDDHLVKSPKTCCYQDGKSPNCKGRPGEARGMVFKGFDTEIPNIRFSSITTPQNHHNQLHQVVQGFQGVTGGSGGVTPGLSLGYPPRYPPEYPG